MLVLFPSPFGWLNLSARSASSEDDEESPVVVKPEVDQDGKPMEVEEDAQAVASAATSQNKQSQLELEIFSEEELEGMNRDVLTADVANLEGQ